MPPVPSRRALIVAILLGAVGVAFEAYAVLAAMPLAAEQLGRVELYAWTFTMFVTGQVLTTVIAGRVADRRGPVPPLAVGFVTILIALAAAGLAPSMEVLLVCRFAQGIGAGAVNLGLMVLIAEVFTLAERPTMIMALSFAWVGPSFIGPPISAWIATHLGWHWVFWSAIPLLGLAAILGTRPLMALKGRLAGDRTPTSSVPLWAAFVAAIGVATVQFAGQQLDPEGDSAFGLPTIVAIATVGIALLISSVPRLMPPGVLTLRPGLPAVMWVRATQAGSFFIMESFLPLILTTQRGFDLVRAGLVLTVGSIGWTFGSWLQARPWLPLRRDQIIIVGAIQAIIGSAIVMAFTAWPGMPTIVALIGFIIAGNGMGFTVTSTSLATMTLSAPAELGRNTSSVQVSEGLGNALLVGAAGAVFAALRQWNTYETTYTTMLGVSLMAAVIATAIALRIGPVRNEARDDYLATRGPQDARSSS